MAGFRFPWEIHPEVVNTCDPRGHYECCLKPLCGYSYDKQVSSRFRF